MNPLVVPQHLVDLYWPHVAPHIEKAFDVSKYTDWSLPTLHRACVMREAFLFVDDAEQPKHALIGRFVNYLAGPAFHIHFFGGEGGYDWKEAMPKIREFAEANGAKIITCHARKGLTRHIKMKQIGVLYEIEAQET